MINNNKNNHQHQTNLSEGLRQGDLKDLILPLISIDEYDSKIGDNSEIIVLAFFVEDEDPAIDLARYIDRSVVELLDTDVSPAPNEEGYFLVFIELYRNEEFFAKILNLINEVNNLTDIKKWTFKAYKSEDIQELTDENLRNSVRVFDQTEDSIKVQEFFSNSLVKTLSYQDGFVTINNKHTLKLVEDITESLSFDFKNISLSKSFDQLLGTNYVTKVYESNHLEIINLNTQETLNFILT